MEHDRDSFRAAIKAMRRGGRMLVGEDQAVELPRMRGHVVGTYRGTRRGFGFVVPTTPDTHGDLFVPEGEGLDAVTGDFVLARVSTKGKRGGKMLYNGRIVEVLERGQSRFVGTLERVKSKWRVRPDGRILDGPIFVHDVAAKNAKADDKVVVEILTWPSPDVDATGVIVEVLGEAGRPDVDLLSVVRQFHIPDVFDEDVIDDARRVSGEFDPDAETDERLDLRGMTLMTIDPVTARDFDDAISIEAKGNGRVELGVHIADVSQFVKPDSPLDEEARLRGNSAYFPNHVIPMLPEVLSNGVCSLQEGQDRFTKSAFVTYDKQGRPVKERFANTIIRSAKRLTYQDATAILDGKTSGSDGKVVALVRRADALARTIRKRRLADGMLVLDLPDVEIKLDDRGRPVDVEPADTSFSHTIIEMFMVEANEAVARLLDRLDWPFLRRIHPDPEEASVRAMGQFLGALGYKIPRDPGRKAIQDLLDSARGKPGAFAVHLAVLRSLQKAEYSPQRVGHYALASTHYAHFTSPIRRYPDLIVHRLLDAWLRSPNRQKQRPVPDFAQTLDFRELGTHCSFTERRAEDAERELRKVYILRMLVDRVGEEFEGVVTGVANFGLFIQLTRYLIDGLVKMEDVGDDWWEVDARRGCVTGQRTGRKIQIGDPVTVKIVLADAESRRLDLTLVRDKSEPPAKESAKAKAKPSPPARGTKKPPRKKRTKR